MTSAFVAVLWGLLADPAAGPVEPRGLTPPPEIDAASVTLFSDQGRLELKGLHLEGVRIAWKFETRAGDDVCLDPRPTSGAKTSSAPSRSRAIYRPMSR